MGFLGPNSPSQGPSPHLISVLRLHCIMDMILGLSWMGDVPIPSFYQVSLNLDYLDVTSVSLLFYILAGQLPIQG